MYACTYETLVHGYTLLLKTMIFAKNFRHSISSITNNNVLLNVYVQMPVNVLNKITLTVSCKYIR